MSGSESLKKRLGYLRAQKKSTPRSDTEKPDRHDQPGPSGWLRRGRYIWERTIEGGDFSFEGDVSPLLCPPMEETSLRFFDLETTGLSVGAGTVAFLAGIGIVVAGHLSVYQVFLSDFPGETEFLKILTAKLPADTVMVSYNGKSYDAALLRTRCLMNGVSFSPPLYHTDLLYPSRRLFRKITGRCSLQVIEEEILGVRRRGDIPGACIPDVYFDYLKTGRLNELEAVFRHNVQDILSLSRLLLYMQRLLSAPSADGPADPLGLGRLLILSGHPTAGAFLMRALEGGNLEAGRLLGYYLKRQGKYTEADAVWTTLAQQFNDLPAAIEKAKHLEHRLKEPRSALAFLEETLARLPNELPARMPDLEHRMKRLRRKARAKPSGGRDR